jgi:hypothetical protein
MGFDIVLLLLVVGGIGLSTVYVRAEYLRWREHGAAQRRRETALRELHAASLSDQRNAALLPGVLKLQDFGQSEAANPDYVSPIDERRKRKRQRV